jgi:cytochrome c oxidase assembly factor CtaG
VLLDGLHASAALAPPSGSVLGSWGSDPGVLAAVLALVAAYVYGARRRPPSAPGQLRDRCFAGAIVALLAALASPIDAAARWLLWAHMLQHMLLIAVAAPLLVLSAPLSTIQLAWPTSSRRRFARVEARPATRIAKRVARNPLVVGFVFSFVWWAWHAPPVYDAAVRNSVLHAAEHLTMLGVSVWWWARFLGRHRSPLAQQFALLVATMLSLNALGALLSLAPRAVFTVYSGAYGLTALEDQQLAGVLMWTTCNFMALVLAGLLVRELLVDDEPVRTTYALATAAQRQGALVERK